MTFGSGPVVMMLIAGSTSISTSSCDADTLTRSWLSSCRFDENPDGRRRRRATRVELCPGPAGVIRALSRTRAMIPAWRRLASRPAGLVVDGGCGAERGCGDEGAVAGEVVAQQRHSPAGLAEDVARLDGPRRRGAARPKTIRTGPPGDQMAGQSVGAGVDDRGGEADRPARRGRRRRRRPRLGG